MRGSQIFGQQPSFRGSDFNMPEIDYFGLVQFRSAVATTDDWDQHEGVELVFVRSGEACWERSDGGLLRVAGGNGVVMPPDRRHRIVNGVYTPCQLFWLLMKPKNLAAAEGRLIPSEEIEAIYEIGNMRQVPIKLSESLLRTLSGLCALLTNENMLVGSRMLMAELRAKFYGLLVEFWNLSHAESSRRAPSPLVNEAERLLQEDTDCQISTISRRLGCRESHFYELFKQEVGMSPNDYRQRQRIRKGCEHLVGSRHSVTEIAMLMGYSSSQYFSRVFRKYVGMTPKEYRARWQIVNAMFYAHSTPDPSRRNWQILSEHLTAVADMAGRFGERIGIGRVAMLAGLLHDLGKYNPEFQEYIAGHGDSVDHSTAGASWAMQLAAPADRLMAQLAAYAIAGHHAGLPDRQGTSRATLDARIKAYVDNLDAAWRDEIEPEAGGLLPGIRLVRFNRDDADSQQKAAFQLAMIGRMLFSCVVDADRRDAEAHDAMVNGWQVDRDWPPLADLIDGMIARYDAHMAGFSADTPVNRLRADILAHVRGKADLPPGFFTLTVPTGGGKTLAALGFALDHARRHHLERIIYAVPFTSIIEQTTAIYRAVLGEDVVLEHHSAIEDEGTGRGETRKADGDGQRGRRRRATEDWAPPVVVTTNVQLFESLFAARPARARKLHNVARSVIVLDEAQTIPLRLLGPAVWALEALVRDWGCSVVLCTATQPALDRRRIEQKATAELIGLDLDPDRELAPDPDQLACELRRVTLRQVGAMRDADLVEALRDTPQAMVIVNSRRHALALFEAVEAAGLEGAIHLSTRQYAVERQRILGNVRDRLSGGQPCRLIATSLVEAGVDLDFPRAWRAEVGLDQLVQTAGRVNREGRRPVDESIVTVFKAPDNPPPPEIAGFVGDMQRMADRFEDLFAPEAITAYFEEVYWRKGREQLDSGVADRQPILGKFEIDHSCGTVFAYRTAAENFRMIESGMLPVIVPREEPACEAVADLEVEGIPTGRLARILQRYTVNVPRARDRLIEAGHARFVAANLRGDSFVVLQNLSLYHDDVGLVWEDADYLSAEQWMI